MLADAAKGPLVWKAIARQKDPQALRMNLNTLLRHDVFGQCLADSETVDYVAARIADADEIRQSRQFPYQYLTAYLNAGSEVPQKIKSALHRTVEIACGNIPQLAGPVVIGLDTSGSMSSPVTGHRGRGATTKMRCVDVAALFAAAILRRSPDSVVVPFDTQAYQVRLDPNDSILSLSGWPSTAAVELTARCRFARPTLVCGSGSSSEPYSSATRSAGFARAVRTPMALTVRPA